MFGTRGSKSLTYDLANVFAPPKSSVSATAGVVVGPGRADDDDESVRRNAAAEQLVGMQKLFIGADVSPDPECERLLKLVAFCPLKRSEMPWFIRRHQSSGASGGSGKEDEANVGDAEESDEVPAAEIEVVRRYAVIVLGTLDLAAIAAAATVAAASSDDAAAVAPETVQTVGSGASVMKQYANAWRSSGVIPLEFCTRLVASGVAPGRLWRPSDDAALLIVLLLNKRGCGEVFRHPVMRRAIGSESRVRVAIACHSLAHLCQRDRGVQGDSALGRAIEPLGDALGVSADALWQLLNACLGETTAVYSVGRALDVEENVAAMFMAGAVDAHELRFLGTPASNKTRQLLVAAAAGGRSALLQLGVFLALRDHFTDDRGGMVSAMPARDGGDGVHAVNGGKAKGAPGAAAVAIEEEPAGSVVWFENWIAEAVHECVSREFPCLNELTVVDSIKPLLELFSLVFGDDEHGCFTEGFLTRLAANEVALCHSMGADSIAPLLRMLMHDTSGLSDILPLVLDRSVTENDLAIVQMLLSIAASAEHGVLLSFFQKMWPDVNDVTTPTATGSTESIIFAPCPSCSVSC